MVRAPKTLTVPLTDAERHDWIIGYNEGVKAMNRGAQSYMPLIKSLAWKAGYEEGYRSDGQTYAVEED